MTLWFRDITGCTVRSCTIRWVFVKCAPSAANQSINERPLCCSTEHYGDIDMVLDSMSLANPSVFLHNALLWYCTIVPSALNQFCTCLIFFNQTGGQWWTWTGKMINPGITDARWCNKMRHCCPHQNASLLSSSFSCSVLHLKTQSQSVISKSNRNTMRFHIIPYFDFFIQNLH